MGYFIYGFVSLIEGTLFYLLLQWVLEHLERPIPPVGSSAFVWFLLLWPLIALVVRPGLRTIPIIGEIFALTESIAKSGFPHNLSDNRGDFRTYRKYCQKWLPS
jgi:hypothetical protein